MRLYISLVCNRRGLGLVESLVAIVVVGIAAMSVGALVVNASRLQQDQDRTAWMSQKRSLVLNEVSSGVAWSRTVALDTAGGTQSNSLSCLTQPAGCINVGAGPFPFDLYDANGTLLFYGTQPGSNPNGFDLQGNPCRAAVSGSCPVQVSLQWSPFCGINDPNCNRPFITVTGTFAPGPGWNGRNIDWPKYGFTVQRSPVPWTKCTGNPPACPPAETAVCLSTGWSCVGAPTGCGLQQETWTPPTSPTCSGQIAAGANGATVNVLSSNGNAGNANYICNNGTYTYVSGTCAQAGAPVAGTCGRDANSNNPLICICQFGVPTCFHIAPNPLPFRNLGTICATGAIQNPSSLGAQSGTAPPGVTGAPGNYQWICNGLSGGPASPVCTQLSGSGGGSQCFGAGSQILMADGSSKNIEDVVAGDEVLSLNEAADAGFANRVVHKLVHPSETYHFVRISFEGGGAIDPTDIHPIWIAEARTSNGYLPASEIAKLFAQSAAPSLHLRDASGTLRKIIAVQTYDKAEAVYDLTVAAPPPPFVSGGGHNYFVNGVLVHNKQACGPS